VRASWKVFWTTQCSCEAKMLVGTMLLSCSVYKQINSGTSTMCCSKIGALYPCLFNPAFAACSTNAGEGLVKLITCSYVPGCWVDVWRSGRFLIYSCEVAFWTQAPQQSGAWGRREGGAVSPPQTCLLLLTRSEVLVSVLYQVNACCQCLRGSRMEWKNAMECFSDTRMYLQRG